MINTVRDYLEASKKIKQNPLAHGYSKEDCEKIAEFEKTAQEFNVKFQKYFNAIDKKLTQASKSFTDSMSIVEEKFKDTRSFVNNDWFISFNFMRNLTMKETLNLI